MLHLTSFRGKDEKWVIVRPLKLHLDNKPRDDSGSQRWLSTAILAGVLYFAIGFASIALAGAAASRQLQSFWRGSAFVVCGLVFLAHIAFEHFRVRNTARPTAWHASVGVAFGAFLLAVSANIHELGSASEFRNRMLIALVAWPLLTAVPAFVVAWILAAGLGLKRRSV